MMPGVPPVSKVWLPLLAHCPASSVQPACAAVHEDVLSEDAMLEDDNSKHVSSTFRGVYKRKFDSKWRAEITAGNCCALHAFQQLLWPICRVQAASRVVVTTQLSVYIYEEPLHTLMHRQ